MSDVPEDAEGEVYPPAPFSFKLMIALGAVYIGWRIIELLVRLVRWLA